MRCERECDREALARIGGQHGEQLLFRQSQHDRVCFRHGVATVVYDSVAAIPYRTPLMLTSIIRSHWSI